MIGIKQTLGVERQKLHCQMNTRALPVWYGEVSGIGSTGSQQHRVVVLYECLYVHIPAHISIDMELNTFFTHELDATVYNGFVQFHIRYSVHKQAAWTIISFVDGHLMSGVIQLRGCGQSAGPEPTMATDLPVLCSGGCGMTQPSSKPRSIMAFSIFLMVTGGLVMPSTQAPSQGAGHTLPVNSGKLLVLCKRSRASCHRPL